MADARLKTPALWLPPPPDDQYGKTATKQDSEAVAGEVARGCFCYTLHAFVPLFTRGAGVAEWQTRGTQNPVSARVCGFDSHLRHQQTQTATWFLGMASGGN
jgi:hypothetical protein